MVASRPQKQYCSEEVNLSEARNAGGDAPAPAAPAQWQRNSDLSNTSNTL